PDHDGLLGPEELVGDDERANRLVVDETAGVADHVCVTFLEPQEAGGVQARIHAGDDGELPPRRHGQAALREPGCVALVGLRDLVDDGHPATSPGLLLYQVKRKLSRLKRATQGLGWPGLGNRL